MTTKELIDNFLAQVKEDLVANYNRLGLRASGAWEKRLEPFNVQEGTMFNFGMKGADYTYWLINGRKPTDQRQGRMDENLYMVIRRWIDDKGIMPKEATMSRNTLAYLITRKIHEEGIKVPNPYNTGTLISDVVNKEVIENFVKKLTGAYIQESKILSKDGN